jgi:protoporphyrinogen/coproporphyrinogen III oxidase
MKKRVAVIGAGIAGLSTAYWLNQHGYDVKVFEKTSHIGGSIVTEKKDGYLIDLGPNSALETSDQLRQLIKDIGLEKQKIYGNEESNNRYVVRNGELRAIPTSPVKFLKSKLFSTKAKFRLFKEPFIKPVQVDDISLAEYVRYRLGPEFLDYAINPFVAGVYAGDPEKLSTPAAFPKLYNLEQKYGSFIKGAIKGARERKKRNEVAKDRAKLFSFIDGMHIFPNTLAEKLAGKIELNAHVVNVEHGDSYVIHIKNGDEIKQEKFDKIVLSIPAEGLAKTLKSLATPETAAYEKIEYPPVSVVFMGFQKKAIQRQLDGFGFLVPKVENRKILGTIWSSTIFPNRAPEEYAALTTFVGGTRQPEVTELNDEELTKVVLEELDALMGLTEKPTFVRIKKWPRAIPQYTMGYPKIQQSYNKLEKQFPGLYFAGNLRRGIGLGDSVLSAWETVQNILNTDQ